MDWDVVISGGGLNGPALALALAQGGLRVAVVDARPAPLRAEAGFDGRAYALAKASMRLLSAIGVWEAVADRAEAILTVRASDGRAGEGAAPFFLSLSSDELEEGPMGFMLEDRFLYAGFQKAMAAQPGITVISGQSVISQEISANGVQIGLSSGEGITARLLVGCDGRGSGVAARAGIRRVGHGYDQTALVTAIRHEKPHDGCAQQFFMPEGPLAILPLAGGYHSSIVWSEQTSRAAAILALEDADFLAALRPRFGDHLGEIELAGTRFSYPLALSLAEHYISERVALAGDAAHGVHPVAGQGLNLGLRDVAALAEVLVLAHRRGEDPGSFVVLEEYQQWRRFDATTLALGMDAVARVFSNDNPLMRLGRDLGLGLVNALPGLRRRVIRQAAGLQGQLPRLLTGRPI